MDSREARQVRMLWEYVQAALALSVTGAILYLAIHNPTDEQQHVRLSSAWFLIIGYYFGRSKERNGGITSGRR